VNDVGEASTYVQASPSRTGSIPRSIRSSRNTQASAQRLLACRRIGTYRFADERPLCPIPGRQVLVRVIDHRWKSFRCSTLADPLSRRRRSTSRVEHPTRGALRRTPRTGPGARVDDRPPVPARLLDEPWPSCPRRLHVMAYEPHNCRVRAGGRSGSQSYPSRQQVKPTKAPGRTADGSHGLTRADARASARFLPGSRGPRRPSGPRPAGVGIWLFVRRLIDFAARRNRRPTERTAFATPRKPMSPGVGHIAHEEMRPFGSRG
jgi:hypothetical protein